MLLKNFQTQKKCADADIECAMTLLTTPHISHTQNTDAFADCEPFFAPRKLVGHLANIHENQSSTLSFTGEIKSKHTPTANDDKR